VDTHVLAQVAGTDEAPFAVGARQRPQLGGDMDGRVPAQCRRRGSSKTTHAAQITAIGGCRVRPAVTLERTDVHELATTNSAQQAMSTGFD